MFLHWCLLFFWFLIIVFSSSSCGCHRVFGFLLHLLFLFYTNASPFMVNLASVSYTHLDVYKRQVHGYNYISSARIQITNLKIFLSSNLNIQFKLESNIFRSGKKSFTVPLVSNYLQRYAEWSSNDKMQLNFSVYYFCVQSVDKDSK